MKKVILTFLLATTLFACKKEQVDVPINVPTDKTINR
jgi:hypothetical protein